MAPVYDINKYRFYKIVKEHLARDGIKCQVKFHDPLFQNWLDKFLSNECSWSYFYTTISAYSLTHNPIITG